MITTQARRISLTVLAALIAATAGTAHANTVSVDINGQSGPNQSGFDSWNIDGSFIVRNESDTFSYSGATDGSVDVNISTTTAAGGRNYGIGSVSDPGNLSIPNVWADLVFFNNNTAGTLTVTLDDLKAGTYVYRSYSYANGLLGSPGSGDSGIADVSIDTGGGFSDTGQNVTLTAGNSTTWTAAQVASQGTVAVKFTVANDNDQVKIRYDGLAANGGDSFGINGFELADSHLRVDIDAQGGPTQADWASWNPIHTDGNALGASESFGASFATDGTVDVTMNSGGSTFERNYNPISGGPFTSESDLLRDLVFWNSDLGDTNFIEIVLNDLEAGQYEFTGYHHLTNAVNGGSPTLDIFVNGADTGVDATTQVGNPGIDAPTFLTNSSFSFNVANNDDVVTIRYQFGGGAGINFGLNGFELVSTASVIPAPAALPAGLMMLGLAATRRRRTE